MGTPLAATDIDQSPATAETLAAEVAALRSGDKQAFVALVRQHHRALVALARGVVGADDAEDVVQRAWVKAYRAIASFEGRASPRSWLGSIVMNEARMALRSRARVPHVFADELEDVMARRFDADGHWSDPPAAWSDGGPEALLMRDQLGECLHKILNALPPQQRAVLELRDMQGQSYEAIGDGLGISVGNVRVLLHRARQRLYLALERYEVTGQC